MTANNKNREKSSKTVAVHDKGALSDTIQPLPLEWPSGQHFVEQLMKPFVAGSFSDDNAYWQASARLALLYKYGHSPFEKIPYRKSDVAWKVELTDNEIASVNEKWEQEYKAAMAGNDGDDEDDLYDLIRTSHSFGRRLQWAVMDTAPGCQFRLHAHPNVELVYAAKGCLHEVRMDGLPLTKSFGSEGEVHGPDLTALQRSWSFATLHEGEWLVNEVGSIHKSFTATKGDGCILICLWGGSHADVVAGKEPASVDVHGAVNAMDQKVSSCSDCTEWGALNETFLPASERASVP